jgi:hypothetical protein
MRSRKASFKHNPLAPEVGLEPTTNSLTANCYILIHLRVQKVTTHLKTESYIAQIDCIHFKSDLNVCLLGQMARRVRRAAVGPALLAERHGASSDGRVPPRHVDGHLSGSGRMHWRKSAPSSQLRLGGRSRSLRPLTRWRGWRRERLRETEICQLQFIQELIKNNALNRRFAVDARQYEDS